MSTTSASGSAGGLKLSMFAVKPGFVIPKNKLSGSLVPFLREGKKPGESDAASVGAPSQTQRKTKWGCDLTQDTAVRRGKALAYQARLDQINQQLKLRDEESVEKELSRLIGDVEPNSPLKKLDTEQFAQLELEKREVIGEIIKLNPTYKPPSDYKPIMKEAKVLIPVNEHSHSNFISLLFGPGGESQIRLESETGAKIQAYGIKGREKEKIEICQPDGSEAAAKYDELNVHIFADTYEKVDAAVAVLELLIASISDNLSAGNGRNLPSKDGDSLASDLSVSIAQGTEQVVPDSGQAISPPDGPPSSLPPFSCPSVPNPSMPPMSPFCGAQPNLSIGFNPNLQAAFLPTRPPVASAAFANPYPPRSFSVPPPPFQQPPPVTGGHTMARPPMFSFPQPASGSASDRTFGPRAVPLVPGHEPIFSRFPGPAQGMPQLDYHPPMPTLASTGISSTHFQGGPNERPGANFIPPPARPQIGPPQNRPQEFGFNRFPHNQPSNRASGNNFHHPQSSFSTEPSFRFPRSPVPTPAPLYPPRPHGMAPSEAAFPRSQVPVSSFPPGPTMSPMPRVQAPMPAAATALSHGPYVTHAPQRMGGFPPFQMHRGPTGESFRGPSQDASRNISTAPKPGGQLVYDPFLPTADP